MFPPKKKRGIGESVSQGERSAPPPKYKEKKEEGEEKKESAPAPAPALPPSVPDEPPPTPPVAGAGDGDDPASDYATRLLSDMTAPLIAAGLDDAGAKELLASIFSAMADCLRGGTSGVMNVGGGVGDLDTYDEGVPPA